LVVLVVVGHERRFAWQVQVHSDVLHNSNHFGDEQIDFIREEARLLVGVQVTCPSGWIDWRLCFAKHNGEQLCTRSESLDFMFAPNSSTHMIAGEFTSSGDRHVVQEWNKNIFAN
jgi:hypothetical protein